MAYSDTPRSFSLYIQPNYIVRLPTPTKRSQEQTEKRIENRKNLMDNSQRGKISAKARRKLMNSVNWLIASASRKWIFDKTTGKRYAFKVNFITLTLPTLNHGISDHKFKSVLLHAFINACRYKYALDNYVWKVETQANGNIHAHFTTDCFIHWKDLRNTWNTILAKHGVIQQYQEKHAALSFEQYKNLYSKNYKGDIKAMRKAFKFGQETNWTSPNSTDVKAVHKVNDIAAYIAKYLSKNDDERRLIKGRLWSCSYSLSQSNKLIVEEMEGVDTDLTYDLDSDKVDHMPIMRFSDKLKQNIAIGDIYFFSPSSWGTVIKGRLLEFYNEHRSKIRKGLVDVDLITQTVQEFLAPTVTSDVEIITPPPQFSIM